MDYGSSSHATHSIGYHMIFCPKFRHTVFNEPIATSLRGIFLQIADHYQKSISTVRLFRMYPQLKQHRFWGSGLWSRGTFYSTVGHVAENVVQKYIETQKQRNPSHGTRPWEGLRRT